VRKEQLLFKRRSPRRSLLGLFAALLLLTISACGSKNTVQIYDNAHVLNSSKVQNVASNLPNPIAIYTTNTFQGTEADFQRTAIQKLNGDPNLIVMAIDTNSRYLYIARGSNVQLSRTAINQAVNSFAGRFNNGNYTTASTAALNSMQNSISAASRASGGGGPALSPLLPCLILPALLILGMLFFVGSRRRSQVTGRNILGAMRNPQLNESQYYGPNQGPNQAYGPSYGPAPRSGLNPWAAGGLGAAAGGFAGWLMGRQEGERGSPQAYRGGDDYGSGGIQGGGGSFGSDRDPYDDSGDFGQGGGGNFGGGFGGSNFFGGGGSFGGNDPNTGGNDSGGGGNF